MSTVIRFPATVAPRILLTGGIVTGGSQPELIGEHRYFIELVEANGTRAGLWDGPHLVVALHTAADLARNFSAVLVDETEVPL